jgi:aspartyl-tRNA(Asn)/glutamyl-tRNA(Gln) amidotransferase subunit C
MDNEITRELFEHLVELAALELSSDESQYLLQELNNQLISIHQLAAIPLEKSTTVTSHGVSYTSEIKPDIRADIHIPCENPEALLDQAPEVEDGYIVVPEIPREELE